MTHNFFFLQICHKMKVEIALYNGFNLADNQLSIIFNYHLKL